MASEASYHGIVNVINLPCQRLADLYIIEHDNRTCVSKVDLMSVHLLVLAMLTSKKKGRNMWK